MRFSIPNATDDPFQILGADKDDELVKSHHSEGFVKSSSARLANLKAYETIVSRRERFPAGLGVHDGDRDIFREHQDPFGGFYWMLKT